MAEANMRTRMAKGNGFIAALDQSGGSTPGALKQYGVPETAYKGDAEMFAQVHEMRVRIMSAPAFTGDKVIAAILFEATMDGQAHGKPVPEYLWKDRQVVPILKVDKGLAAENDGVALMKPMPDLDKLLDRAVAKGIFGTKMRSVIHHASPTGIAAIVAQQFEVGAQIAKHGLVPIIEPEVSINAPDKAECEALLRDAIVKRLDALPDGGEVMLKLTIPTKPDFYAPLIAHPKVLRVVALSGGYSRNEACRLLAENHGMIASFSRALVEDLHKAMSDTEFNAGLAASIDEIYKASTVKSAAAH
jgi:fructose-bisphosphate aldolase, class I